MKKKKDKRVKENGKSISFMDIISGDFLLRDFIFGNLPFVLFLVFLGLILVSKGYYAKQLIKDINKNQIELDAVTADYVEAKAKLEEETMRGNLVEILKEREVKEATSPVKVIKVEK